MTFSSSITSLTVKSGSARLFAEQSCLGRESCEVLIDRNLFNKNGDGCPDIVKTLAIQARCSH